MALSTTKKRNELSLQKKYELLQMAEKNPTLGVRKLAEYFSIGKTQASTILKNKVTILESYEGNASSDICRSLKRARTSQFADVNDRLYDWYLMAVHKNIYPDGPKICQKAKEIAQHLDISDFKASNGWLEKWKLKHNIRQMTISGESGEVKGETVDSWKERIPEIIHGYSAKDIWNMDKTGCFWRALPDKGLGQKGKLCKGGKSCKQRVTVAFFVNAAGGKEGIKPIVVWTSENLRCFKGVDKSCLLVSFYSQAKSWMTGDIMHRVLLKVNNQLKSQSRSIALLMDNAGCHPQNLLGKYSNIKILFLPPNTTSVLQPLDLGIIKNFKVHYRKLLMQHVLAKIEECSSAHEVVKSVNILLACRWVAQAWELVSSDTIKNASERLGLSTLILIHD